MAETIGAHVKKGTQLLVLGRLTFKPWLTNSGEPRAGAEVILQSFEFAGGNRKNGPEGDAEHAVGEPAYTGPVDEQQPAPNGEAAEVTSPAENEPYVDQF